MLTPFHLAIPVTDLAEAEAFYGDVMGCPKGRSDSHWIDWDLFGHQLVTHRVEQMPSAPKRNNVDGDAVPVPHFGVVLLWDDWQQLGQALEDGGCDFIIAPRVRFRGQVGEQGTFFLLDPFGNALEFKAFKELSQLFANE